MKVSPSAWRISAGSISARVGRRAAAALLVPVIEHCPRGLMFHGRHLFRRETAPALRCPRLGHARRLFAATSSVEQGACRRRRAAGGAPRVSVKITIALAAAQSAARVAVDPSTRAFRRAKALLFSCRRACGGAAKRRNSQSFGQPPDRCETRTALQHSARHRGAVGGAGAHSRRAHLLLTEQQDIEFLLTFAFIPARYDTSIVLGGALPGGFGAQIWTFVTYALHPRRLDASRRQRDLVAAFRQRGGAALRRRCAFWCSSR